PPVAREPFEPQVAHPISSDVTVAATPESEVEPAAEVASEIERKKSLDVGVPRHRGVSAPAPLPAHTTTTATTVASAAPGSSGSCGPETFPRSATPATPVSPTEQQLSPPSPRLVPGQVEVGAAAVAEATEAARLGAFFAAGRHAERGKKKKTGGHKRRPSRAFLLAGGAVAPRSGAVEAVAGGRAVVLTAAEVEMRQVTLPLLPGRAAPSPSISLQPRAALLNAPTSSTTSATIANASTTNATTTTTITNTTDITAGETAKHASVQLRAPVSEVRSPVPASAQAERQAVMAAGRGDKAEAAAESLRRIAAELPWGAQEAAESLRRIAAELPRGAQEAFCMPVFAQLSRSETEEAEA
ncbi:unnamed protein product, partial [Laminaria digitata]